MVGRLFQDVAINDGGIRDVILGLKSFRPPVGNRGPYLVDFSRTSGA